MYKARAYACGVRPRLSPGPPSPAASRCRPTCRSRSCTAASATPTCTRPATSGRRTDVYPCVPGHEIVGRVTEVGAG